MKAPVELRFCDRAETDRHRAFLHAQCSVELSSALASPSTDESWMMMAEWDAAHEVPNAGDGKVNPPGLVAWSPTGDRLFTSCDAFGLTVWEAGALAWDRNPRILGADLNSAAYGYPIRFFPSQRRYDTYVLMETMTGRNQYYSIYTGEATPLCRGTNAHLWGWGLWASVAGRRLNRTAGIDPWKTGSHGCLAFIHNYSTLKVVDVTKLPDRPLARRDLWFEFYCWITGRAQSAGRPMKVPVHEASVERWISFDSLGTRDNTIFGYHFHPTGEYLAVTTGDYDSERRRSVHIVHLASAAIVASVPMTAESLGWSEGGRYLVCRRSPEWVCVWDSATFEEIPEPAGDLLAQPWILKALAAAEPDLAISADGQRLLANSATSLCNTKRSGSRIVPGEELAKIASQPFAHAAWHPTDPHCFATVGGAPSKELPATYKRDGVSHGRLLRLWAPRV